ncbi:unnamed protein product [Microthlaspi erraticum]|uniref:Reverse transcriptase domain-containing protein n=1 Tax=Microthlaspi erraticum TaxID=1685480 RepID=A0A6D2HUU8_9BRAS|nr:unnamed protein product [Microthlaspi erraticum]
MFEACDMQDIRTKGNRFSWVGHTRDGVVECCLDRVIANIEWRQAFPVSETEFLDLAESDHRPLMVSIEYENRVKRGQFRYDKRLAQDEDFVHTVAHFWSNTNHINPQFSSKLKLCRREMAKWKRSHRFNAAEDIQTIRCQLDIALRDPNRAAWEIRKLRSDLNQAFHNEEVFWKLKSRNKWLQVGDRNTAYFHGVTKARKQRTCIKQVTDEAGIVHTKDGAIAKVAEEYFQQMFTASETLDIDDVIPVMDQRVTAAMNECLLRPVIEMEIKEAVLSIGSDKAPSHDGYTASFYQRFWEEIRSDLCLMVRKFFETRIMEPKVNHTQLCLIPKPAGGDKIADYRPISLCTVSYKVISKLLVSRLQGILGSLILESQAAFVPGRNISHNVLVAHELMHALKAKRNCAEQFIAIKTDISKAYDRVEWNFLEAVMKKMGFAEQWITWVMACVRSVSFSMW